MPPLWTIILLLVPLILTLFPPVESQQGQSQNFPEVMPPPPHPPRDSDYYEEAEKSSEDFDDSYFEAQQNQGQSMDYQYQDESAFLKDAQSYRKVMLQQSNIAVKTPPPGHQPPSIMVVSDSDEDSLSDNKEPSTSTTTTEEPYQIAIDRLSCDNPWFWNAFKCFYLDVRERNYVERTTSNGKTVAYILGPPTAILLFALFSFCAVTCYFKARVKALERRMEEIRNKYEPGSIELDDGTIRKYTPNQEEIDAFENMIATLISIV